MDNVAISSPDMQLKNSVGDKRKTNELNLDAFENKKSKTDDKTTSQVSEANQTLCEIDEFKKQGEIDVLNYTKWDNFTSEIYKVQIRNLPKLHGHNQLKKRLKNSLNLNPHKTRVDLNKSSWGVAYVCFRSEAEKLDAISKIHGHVWKGKTLEAKTASPNADPFLKKKIEASEESKLPEKEPTSIVEPKTLTKDEAEARLKEKVLPLWNVSYEEQLQIKTKSISDALEKIVKHDLTKDYYKRGLLKRHPDGGVCPMEPILPSPITSEYRNKNEFTIGYKLDGKEVCVGFRYGLYRDGTTSVGDPYHMNIAMPEALPVVKSFTEFLQTHPLTPFLQQDNSGHWHTLTVRTYRSGDVLAMVDIVRRKLTQEQIEDTEESIRKFYQDGGGKEVKITSFHLRICESNGPGGEKKSRLIFGNEYVYEDLLGLKFRISPEAFFQINSLATEKLYELIGQWSGVSDNTVLIDVCCGTGTIGLSLAKKVKSVIGIEMCKEAIEDAEYNASINDISNATFHCARVEAVISSVLSSLPRTDQVIAVVDPPRAGLHKNVIKTLRRSPEINRLVYVSCSPQQCTENFADLIRPATGKHPGPPFTLVRAAPVDLFPSTPNCELVLLFQRGDGLSEELQKTMTPEQEEIMLKKDKLREELETKKKETGEDYVIYADQIMLRVDVPQFKKEREKEAERQAESLIDKEKKEAENKHQIEEK